MRPGRLDPEAIEARRHLLTEARRRPSRMTLALDDSLFTVVPAMGRRLAVPMDGENVDLPPGEGPTSGRVEWEELEPRLQRIFGRGGTIIDHFELVDRERLVVTRTVQIGGADDIRMRFVYDRKASEPDRRDA